MTEKIACAQQPSGLVRPLTQPGDIVVYRRGAKGWEPSETIVFAPGSGAAGLRASIDALANRLGDCRILVAGQLGGIPYQTLNRLGFHLFEAECVDDALLSGIWRDVQALPETPAPPPVPLTPQSPASDGHYVLDLVALQAAHPEISSKMAFRAFLEGAAFRTFTLRCAHLPPWALETAERHDIAMRTYSLADGTVEIVFHRQD